MMPAVPVPKNSGIRSPVEVKLKPNWRYDTSRRTFVSDDGDEFLPGTDVPKGTKLVYKIPGLADIDDKKLSTDEKDLKRYMQVILPAGESPKQYVDIVRSWDSVEDAQVAPEISLPGRGF